MICDFRPKLSGIPCQNRQMPLYYRPDQYKVGLKWVEVGCDAVRLYWPDIVVGTGPHGFASLRASHLFESAHCS